MTDPFADKFDVFDQHLELSPQQRNIAESRSRHISWLLSQNAEIIECRIVGSLARSTAIQNFSDVDILAVFDPKKIDLKDSRKLLSLVERIVKPFGGNVIRTSIAVSLQYLNWPKVDILPGWVFDDGARGDFHIPAEAGGEWQVYSPDRHDRTVNDASVRLGPRFKKLIRIIKRWNSMNDNPLKSYEIEALIADLFSAEIPNYVEAIYRVFNEIIDKLIDCPPCGDDDTLLEVLALPSVSNARLVARETLDMEIDGRNKGDIEASLRRLFGEQFPHVRS